MNETPRWLVRAKETYKYHRAKRILDPKWTLQMTATSLKRSMGGISEDLKIASFSKTHEKQLEQYSRLHEALEFIRKKQKEIDLADLDS